MKREYYQTEKYFTNVITATKDSIKNLEETLKMKTTNEDKARISYGIYLEYISLLMLKYSIGDPIPELKNVFLKLLSSLYEYVKYRETFTYFGKSLETYVEALWLVSFALLFDIEKQEFKRITNIIGHEGEDLLYELLVSKKIDGRKKAGKMYFPKQYSLLYEVMFDKDNKKILKFLSRYYNNMKSCYWHGRHESDDSGFFGYWCIELAAAVKLFGIDDSSFKDNMYYPKDLI
jgi:hypothetical protein